MQIVTKNHISNHTEHWPIQRITAHIPKKLLNDAMLVSGVGITETIKAGLAELTKAEAYKKFRKLKGKVKFSIDLKKLREDR